MAKIYELIAEYDGYSVEKLNTSPPWFDVFAPRNMSLAPELRMTEARKFKTNDLGEALSKVMELGSNVKVI